MLILSLAFFRDLDLEKAQQKEKKIENSTLQLLGIVFLRIKICLRRLRRKNT